MLPTTDRFHDPATEVVGTSIPHDESLFYLQINSASNRQTSLDCQPLLFHCVGCTDELADELADE